MQLLKACIGLVDAQGIPQDLVKCAARGLSGGYGLGQLAFLVKRKMSY